MNKKRKPMKRPVKPVRRQAPLPAVRTDTPIALFVKLDMAVERGDHAAAAEAQRKLARLGFTVSYDSDPGLEARRREAAAENYKQEVDNARYQEGVRLKLMGMAAAQGGGDVERIERIYRFLHERVRGFPAAPISTPSVAPR